MLSSVSADLLLIIIDLHTSHKTGYRSVLYHIYWVKCMYQAKSRNNDFLHITVAWKVLFVRQLRLQMKKYQFSEKFPL